MPSAYPLDGSLDRKTPREEGGQFAVANARIVTPETLIESGYVVVSGDEISSVGSGSPPVEEPLIDLAGRTVVPGLIDLHGDDIERHCAPRPEASVDPGTARLTCERENAAAGITTKYHALAFEEAPEDSRSPTRAAHLADVLAGAADPLIDHRIHARCEVGNEDCLQRVLRLLAEDPPDMVSAMHHVPEVGQFEDDAAFDRRYAGDDVLPRRDASGAAVARRTARLVEAATAAGVPVASHDEGSPARVERHARLGVDLFEYPVTMAAATRARALGVPTAMGAPNLLRGGSLWDNLCAREAIDAGVVDVLCSDYHPQSLLESVFVDTGEPLTDRVARVTSAPAAVAGLDDRGRLTEGKRADFVVIGPESSRAVTRVFVAGRETFRARPTPPVTGA
jgi:alpha-D-ribose 1-methylphosphonate 5-triphosphate diphosphatase